MLPVLRPSPSPDYRPCTAATDAQTTFINGPVAVTDHIRSEAVRPGPIR